MEIVYVGQEFGRIMIYGFASGFTVGLILLGVSSVVHRISNFYHQG